MTQLLELFRNTFNGKANIVATTWDVPDHAQPKEDRFLHPEGIWSAKVVAGNADTSKNGKVMLRFTYKTSQGNVNGRLVLSPESQKAKWAFFKQLANMGVDKTFLDQNPDPDEVAAQCVHAQVLVRINHREYLGDVFPDVAWVDAHPEPALD